MKEDRYKAIKDYLEKQLNVLKKAEKLVPLSTSKRRVFIASLADTLFQLMDDEWFNDFFDLQKQMIADLKEVGEPYTEELEEKLENLRAELIEIGKKLKYEEIEVVILKILNVAMGLLDLSSAIEKRIKRLRWWIEILRATVKDSNS